MRTDRALETVYKSILGENSLIIKLRNRQGLDDEEFSQLKDAMKILIDSYKDNEEIPKRLALCFVDISVRFSFNENWYNEKERDRLEDAANELSYLAEKLFA
ncbi:MULTISPECIES: hypothetical protein [Lysinibacillus]|uniref:Uncharacterized protein n=1 Tax=Lysinibacillus xylanilyticus TaxID=582475 RepID=A0ABV3VXR9_9BACI